MIEIYGAGLSIITQQYAKITQQYADFAQQYADLRIELHTV